MKKLFILLFMIVLFSCKKDNTYCWQCNKEVTAPNYYSSSIIRVCGMTYDERSEFEQSNTYESGIYKQTMNCKVKE